MEMYVVNHKCMHLYSVTLSLLFESYISQQNEYVCVHLCLCANAGNMNLMRECLFSVLFRVTISISTAIFALFCTLNSLALQ